MKPIPIILTLILLSTLTYAIVDIQEYNGVRIKVYDNTSIDIQDVYDLIDETQPYINGTTLRILTNYKFRPYWCALYHQPDMIDLFCLDRDSIVHELTHRLQFYNKEYQHHIYYHTGRFCKYYYQIWDDVYTNQSYGRSNRWFC